jgi:BASS family bile acid:Na+ symporter
MNELLLSISRWALLTFLMASMLELGLSLTLAQVLASLKNMRLIACSIVANFLVGPLLSPRSYKSLVVTWHLRPV